MYPMAAAGRMARAVAAGIVAITTTWAPFAFNAAIWFESGPASVAAS